MAHGQEPPVIWLAAIRIRCDTLYIDWRRFRWTFRCCASPVWATVIQTRMTLRNIKPLSILQTYRTSQCAVGYKWCHVGPEKWMEESQDCRPDRYHIGSESINSVGPRLATSNHLRTSRRVPNLWAIPYGYGWLNINMFMLWSSRSICTSRDLGGSYDVLWWSLSLSLSLSFSLSLFVSFSLCFSFPFSFSFFLSLSLSLSIYLSLSLCVYINK